MLCTCDEMRLTSIKCLLRNVSLQTLLRALNMRCMTDITSLATTNTLECFRFSQRDDLFIQVYECGDLKPDPLLRELARLVLP